MLPHPAYQTIFILVTSLFLNTLGATTLATDSTNPKPDNTPQFNRRVLVLDFVNQRRSAEDSYLEKSIPDAFESSLQKTRSFEILPRTLGEKVILSLGIKAEDLYSEENALKIGKATGADVIIIGNFLVIGGKDKQLRMQAKAIDVVSSRIADIDTEEVKMDSSLFTGISVMADRMSSNLRQKLPPLLAPAPVTPPVVDNALRKTEAAKQTYPLTIWGGPALSVPLGYIRPVYTLGIGGKILATADGLASLITSLRWLEPIRLGLEIGFFSYPAGNSAYETLLQVPMQFQIAYGLRQIPTITLYPFVSVGVAMGRFSNIAATRNYRMLAWAAGLAAEYRLRDQVYLLLLTNWYAEYDSGVNSFWQTTLMAGYRWNL